MPCYILSLQQNAPSFVGNSAGTVSNIPLEFEFFFFFYREYGALKKKKKIISPFSYIQYDSKTQKIYNINIPKKVNYLKKKVWFRDVLIFVLCNSRCISHLIAVVSII